MSQQPPPGERSGAAPGSSGDINSELESFRQQWKAEVKAKTTTTAEAPQQESSSSAGPSSPTAQRRQLQQQSPTQQRSAARRPSVSRAAVPVPPVSPPRAAATLATAGGGARAAAPVLSGAPQSPLKLFSSGRKPFGADYEDDYIQPRSFDEVPGIGKMAVAKPETDADDAEAEAGDGSARTEEPVTALEHYEKAAEKEAIGSLGDSLRLYRKAFRMDHAVDKKYKNKHYPAPPPGESSTGNQAAGAVPAKTAAAASAAAAAAKPPTVKELIQSFSGLAIEAAPPPIDGMPQEPCPLADLPDEILVQVLSDVAEADVGDFVRLAQVCKKLAYLVATEDSIWRGVCLGRKFGFARMPRSWEKTVEGQDLVDDGNAVLSPEGQLAESEATTLSLRALYPSWQRMFRQRPRIRFNGVYISTVNYIRSGQASVNLVTWNSPVHIVTYFRYLRFFRDGTVISLLTTAEPLDVIHHLTKDLLVLHEDGAMAHLPSAVVKGASRGRWRLSSVEEDAADEQGGPPADLPIIDVKTGRALSGGGASSSGPGPSVLTLPSAIEAESDVVVETEGVGKYYYRMELSFRTAGKGARNNKLVWRGFYSYNRLTDDWGEFGLKNDKPFFFSRVKSYGLGE